jgi:hypothetical protein
MRMPLICESDNGKGYARWDTHEERMGVLRNEELGNAKVSIPVTLVRVASLVFEYVRRWRNRGRVN